MKRPAPDRLATGHRPLTSQRGFSIITVVFVLVVLAGLGAVMVQLATTQHLGMAMAQDGRQAYYAARAGLEWGRYKLVKEGVCAASSLTVAGFDVNVTCAARPEVTEGDQRFTAHDLTSTSTLDAGVLGTVRRDLQMAVWVKTSGP
ncbi:MAG: pilus assembly protein MshP [Chloroflexota bacterium]